MLIFPKFDMSIGHDAENVGDEPSLHITVGLITKTWADLLLESISELALNEPAFRRSLPAGFANRDFDRDRAGDHFDMLIDIEVSDVKHLSHIIAALKADKSINAVERTRS